MIIEYKNEDLISSIFLSDNLLKEMIRIGEEHYPKEIGGIILGIRNTRQSFILDFELPKEYNNGKNYFERGVLSLNQYLSRIYNTSQSNIQYLGEWHTHPDGSALFSSDDYNSIKNIAQDNLSKNPTPYLIIFKSGMKKESSFYQFTQNKLIKLKKNYE